MNRTPRTFVLLAAALLCTALSGCLGNAKDAPAIFAPALSASPDPAWPAVSWQLSIARPSAPRMLDSSRIAVSPVPGELQVYANASWASAPGEMLEDSVLRTLEDSGKLPAVARQGSGIGADYRLVLDIRHFEADYAGAATPSALIEVNAKLLHTIDQSVIGTRTVRHAVPATGTEIARVADAFGQALQATSRDIAGWVLETGQAHERSHAPKL
jgi:cholesterol transport system auxiliary component